MASARTALALVIQRVNRLLRFVFDSYGDFWPGSLSLDYAAWLADLSDRADEGGE